MRPARRRTDERVYRIQCRCIWVTALAICVDVPTQPGTPHTWIPNAAIHPRSTLTRRADGIRSTLLVRAWFAKKKGWLR